MQEDRIVSIKVESELVRALLNAWVPLTTQTTPIFTLCTAIHILVTAARSTQGLQIRYIGW